jgi:hypothetical protein
MGALFAVKWVATILGHLAAGTAPSHVELTVWPLDLIVALPALFWGGVWLWRRQPWGYVVGGLLLLKMALLGPTLLLNSWLVTLWGRPLDPMVPFYALVGLGGLAGLLVYLRCLTPSGSGLEDGFAGRRPRAPGDRRDVPAGRSATSGVTSPVAAAPGFTPPIRSWSPRWTVAGRPSSGSPQSDEPAGEQRVPGQAEEPAGAGEGHRRTERRPHEGRPDGEEQPAPGPRPPARPVRKFPGTRPV